MLTEVNQLSVPQAIHNEFSLEELPDLATLFTDETNSSVFGRF
jgi:hypothetical protein